MTDHLLLIIYYLLTQIRSARCDTHKLRTITDGCWTHSVGVQVKEKLNGRFNFVFPQQPDWKATMLSSY